MADMSPMESIWAAVFLTAWLLLAAVHLMSLRWGAILGITAGRGAILRKERPAKFWLTWFLLAWPFVILPFAAVAGLFLSGEGS